MSVNCAGKFRTAQLIALAIFSAGLAIRPVYAEGECKACLRDKLDGVRSKDALDALVAAGGGATGVLPGVACAAVLGGGGPTIANLQVEVAKCADVCRAEAKARNDASAGSCTDLVNLLAD